MGIAVAVAGASGYAGGELLRLLASHPGMTLGPVTAESHVGEPVAAVHPHLSRLSGRRFETTDPERLARADLVFLALPHGRSAAVAASVPGNVKIVDLGADFRLADPGAWQEFYDGEHAGQWQYGLAEPSDIVIVAASGTSGAGRAPRPDLVGAEVMGAMSAYQVGGVHRHTPEIEQALGELAGPDSYVWVSFTPTLAPMPRGILATCT